MVPFKDNIYMGKRNADFVSQSVPIQILIDISKSCKGLKKHVDNLERSRIVRAATLESKGR